MRRRILLVEDEPKLGRLVQRHLEQVGYTTKLVSTGDAALRATEQLRFDLVLLDLMLPDCDGFDVCRRVRRSDSYVPLLMLTARSSEGDRVQGLDIGADDYLTKPFSLAELVARINALLRRVDALASNAGSLRQVTVAGVVSIDPETREVRVRDRSIDLTHKEFDLLWHLAHKAGRVYSRAQLLDAVWGPSHEGYEHAVNCHINRLRAKIEDDPAHPKLVQTVWGVGYKFANGTS